MKFDDGLIVTAGTINPHAPRTAIPSEGIPRWLEYGKDPKDSAEATASGENIGAQATSALQQKGRHFRRPSLLETLRTSTKLTAPISG